MRIVLPNGTEIGTDRLVSSVLRTDATPIVANLEFQCILDPDLDLALSENNRVLIGDNYLEMVIIKRVVSPSSHIRDGNQVVLGAYIAVIAGCEKLINPTSRAVYLENTTFGEIFRACGCNLKVEDDVPVDKFFCPIGVTPTYELARKMCEEATFPFLNDKGRVSFRRLLKLNSLPVNLVVGHDEISWIKNPTEENQLIPNYQTINEDGSTVEGTLSNGVKATFYPNLDARKAKNLSTALVVRGTITRGYAPSIVSGHIVDIKDSVKYVVLTSAHRFDTGVLGGATVSASKLWIAEVVQK